MSLFCHNNRCHRRVTYPLVHILENMRLGLSASYRRAVDLSRLPRPLGVFLFLARVSVLLRKPSRPLAEVVIRFFPPSPVSVVLVASLGATWRSPADFVGFRRLLSSVDPFGSDFRL